MLVLRLGWRNIWRNGKRSLITISAISCGFAFLIVLIGLMIGLSQQMLVNGTRLILGDLQIHHTEYLPDRNLFDTVGGEQGIELDLFLERLGKVSQVVSLTPRVHGFGLLSTGERSAGTQLLGVDPDRERRTSNFLSGLRKGRPLDGSKPRQILLGDTLAQELEAGVGSEVAIVTQAADGSLGNDLFQVVGILHTGLAHLDRSLSVLQLRDLQELLAMTPGRVHEIAVRIADPMEADRFVSRLTDSGLIPPESRAQSWGDLSPQLRDYIGLAQGMYGFIILIIGLFTAISVLNTMMMAVFERTREIGLMGALGMGPTRMVSAILLESLFLGLLGVAGGLALGALMMSYLTSEGLDLSRWMGELSMLGTRMDPVLKAAWEWDYVLWSAVGLLAATLVAALIPALRAVRLDPVVALSAPVEG